jgi:protein ImuB
MPRIGCLLVPDLPVAAACRADPALLALPLVLADGDGPHARIVAASHAARARGIRAGRLTVAQARAVAADLVVRQRNVAAERSARDALGDVAASLASRVERTADGTIFLDASGMRHLTDTEAGLATALVARAERVGLGARAAIADGMAVARLAARYGSGTEVVPPGMARGFLAAFPVASLDPPLAVRRTLERWGIRRLGQLARLPEAEVTTRLGPAGAALVRLARGEDERPFMPTALEDGLEEGTLLDHPIDAVEPLLFVLRGLLERLVDRLGLAAVGCARLGLALRLEDGGRDVRTLGLAAPTRDQKTMLALLRQGIEAKPPRAAITECRLHALPEAIRATQLGLFTPAGPAPERLATTLARLGVLCADGGRLGAPAIVDTHVPGRAATAPFEPPPAAPSPSRDVPATTRLVIRSFRPPVGVEVFHERDVPSFLRGAGIGGRVVGMAGPWRVAAEWWADASAHRDYYDLELSDGGVYRCFQDLRSTRWFVDGVYD